MTTFDIYIEEKLREFVGQVSADEPETAAAMVAVGLELLRALPADVRAARVEEAIARRGAAVNFTDTLMSAEEKRLERN